MYVGPYAKAINLRQMQQLHALDLLSLLWAYADAVAIGKGSTDLPSVIYEETQMHALSKQETGKMLRSQAITGYDRVDKVLIEFHQAPFVRTKDV